MGVDSRRDRLATGVLELAGRRLWGFRPRLMAFVVRDRGAGGSLLWFVANMPRYERTRSVEGAARTHLWCAAISLENGCAYCTYGHALALELLYFRDSGRLFPINEGEIVKLVHSDRATQRHALKAAVLASGIAAEVAALDRLYSLADGGVAETATERRMRQLMRMFSVLNMCGRAGCVAPDEAHDPINKDSALKQRYQSARIRS